MDRGKRLLRAACTALTAALMAGCSACMIARAMGLDAPWVGAYLLAAASAALAQPLRRGGARSLCAGAALALGFGLLLAAHAPKIAALVRLLTSGGEAGALEAARSSAGVGVGCVLAFLLGALLAGLLRAPSGAPFALLVLLSSVIFALAAREELSVWSALPGLMAGVAAFGLPADARRDGVAPALLIPAALLAALALALTPGQRVTWEPLERLAEQVRSVVEDYVRFTERRVAFSIGEKGFDRAGMIGDDAVSMLGGPANPTHDTVMRVETDGDLLLRGAIKRSYTGYSWVDDQVKARYLYYDFTHRRVRDRVFDADTSANSPAFAERSARVEMLESGTSTLFVPAQLRSFQMNLRDAVYYNSAGELFLTRDVRAGDRYEFAARVPASRDALVEEAAARAERADARFDEVRADYSVLPPNIDSRVYALAVELTQRSANPAEKAYAIQDYLARNFRYTLDGGYPADGADFVSWFLLESKEGYCSYFATAMTVLCRIAGLPARYVEGYSVHAQSGGETVVTGENAHAWTEVYLNGLGWVAFDPTAAAWEAQGSGGPGGMPNEDSDIMEESAALDPEGGEDMQPGEGAPTPSPSPDDGEDSGDEGGDESPDAGEDEAPDEGADESPEDGGMDELPDDGANESPDGGADASSDGEGGALPPDGGNSFGAWLWVLLCLLALAALAWLATRWIRRRLRESDPLALSAHPADMDAAALLLYRAMLTLLNQLGFAPQNAETPEAFAARVSEALANPDYLRFAGEVARRRYAGEAADETLVRSGRRAYLLFLRRMRRLERLKFHARRILRGLGDTEVIP